MFSHPPNLLMWKHSQISEWISQCDAMLMFFLSNFFSLLCIVESLERQIPAHLHKATPEFICLHHCHLASFSFPTLRALLSLPGRLLHLQDLSSYSAIFSSCGHWICEMWACLGVANSTEMPSVWFAALFPIMLNHCLSSWALCVIRLMFTQKQHNDTSLAVTAGLEAITILTSFLTAKRKKLKIQSRNQCTLSEFASTEFFWSHENLLQFSTQISDLNYLE